MRRQRTGKASTTQRCTSQLLAALRKYLPARGLALISHDQRIRWTDRMLVTLAMLMSWLPSPTQREAFEAGREVLIDMYDSRRRPGRCLKGFLAALAKRSARLLKVMMPCLRKAVMRIAGPQWRWKDWALMTPDGSRVNCPRTEGNEQALGRAGRNKTAPQLFLTMVLHLGTGLIWDWRRGRGNSAERDQLREMLSALPQRTLLVADAGFTGYDLLRELRRAKHSFVIRVGSNVTLLKKLGYAVREHEGIVYLWPQNRRKQRPLILRLVRVHDGRKEMCLLTDVLDESKLSDREVAELYRLRWIVEVQFRSLKQTMERRKMLSTTPGNAVVELDWAVVAMWMLELMTAEAVARRDRRRWSVAKTLQVVRRMLRGRQRPPAGGLRGQLRKAVIDRYARKRSKSARNWPHKKRERPPGTPRVRTANRSEALLAQKLRAQKPAA